VASAPNTGGGFGHPPHPVVQRHGETCQRIVNRMRERLGCDYFTKGQDVAFELTPKGRSVVRYDGLMFWLDDHDDDELVVSRVRGGRAEFGHVAHGGDVIWTLVPLAAAGVN
jgi:hypothetical protein